MTKKKVGPVEVVLTREHLTINWNDGKSTQFILCDLRKNCPCAVCRESRGETDGMVPGEELPMLSTESMTATSVATNFDYVGRYGIRINWADGHNAGIYTYAALREFSVG